MNRQSAQRMKNIESECVPEDLRRYVYLSVAGSEEERFDPEDITRRTGIEPTDFWRLEDHSSPSTGKRKRFDFWKLESPLGRAANLTLQTQALFSQLVASGRPVSETLKPLGPNLQYVVYTANAPVDFVIDFENVRRLLDLGAEVDCDLYWVCNPSIDAGHCTSCGLAVPTRVEEARHYIGGEQRAAEVQMRLALYGIDRQEANHVFELDPHDKSSRLDDNLEVCDIEALDCLQFSSDFLPTSGYIPSLEPEEWAMQFANLIIPTMARISSGTRREFVVSLTERGNFQGTAGLHFNLDFLNRISDLQASLGVRLRYVPEPYVRATGECFHCDVNVLKG